eukprot:2692893-Ditylum_brightwellii.AAC.1
MRLEHRICRPSPQKDMGDHYLPPVMSQQVFQSQMTLFQVQMLELKPSISCGSIDDGPGCVLVKA